MQQRKLSLPKKIAFATIFFAMLLVLAELGMTLAVGRAISPPERTFYAFEDSGKTIRFDPVRGYWLSQTPSRFVRVTNGEIECSGVIRGNAQGYPDAHDFTIKKPAGVAKRFLVFGDSFTAGWGLETNWPDRIEQSRPNWQLYNLSTDGGGLANWYSNLTRFAIPEGYQFDAVVFAVFFGDTKRSFTLKDHRNVSEPLFARAGWRPETWPKTQAEADVLLKPLAGDYASHILSTEDFEQAFTERTLTIRQPLKPWITSHVLGLKGKIERLVLPAAAGDGQYDAEQRWLIDGIREQLHVPIIVVRVPNRECLIGGGREDESEEFAKILGARFIDGADAFSGLSKSQIRALFFKHDGHWNQGGSDRLAHWLQSALTHPLPAPQK